MKRYIIKVKLPNLDEIHAKVVATSETAAINRVIESEEFKKFIGITPLSEIKFYCDGEEGVKPVQIDDCRLTTFEGVGCAVEHVASGVIIGFEEGRFNATAEALNYPAMMTAEQIATIMREVGEWLYCFHKRKIMSIREITRVWMKENKITNRALAAEIGTSENAFSAYIRGFRPLTYECIENLLIILQQAGQL